MSSATVTDEASSAPRQVGLAIGGMTCAACAARVEKKLNGIDSVVATMNFATGQALVAAPASVSPQRLIESVERAGYCVAVVPSGGGPAGDEGVVRPGGGDRRRGAGRVRAVWGVDTSMMTGEPVPADARAGAAPGSSLELTEPQQQVAS